MYAYIITTNVALRVKKVNLKNVHPPRVQTEVAERVGDNINSKQYSNRSTYTVLYVSFFRGPPESNCGREVTDVEHQEQYEELDNNSEIRCQAERMRLSQGPRVIHY